MTNNQTNKLTLNLLTMDFSTLNWLAIIVSDTGIFRTWCYLVFTSGIW